MRVADRDYYFELVAKQNSGDWYGVYYDDDLDNVLNVLNVAAQAKSFYTLYPIYKGNPHVVVHQKKPAYRLYILEWDFNNREFSNLDSVIRKELKREIKRSVFENKLVSAEEGEYEETPYAVYKALIDYRSLNYLEKCNYKVK